MSKRRTEKSKYPSRYSPQGYVHAAQYITELICEMKAKKDGGELPVKFWTLSKWNKYYKYQITLANKLLKKYSESCVISAMRDSRSKKTYSLRSPVLINIIEECIEKDKAAEKVKKDVKYDFKKKETFESNNTKRSIISKLRDLE